jgi:transmembrane sensor
MFHLPDGSWGWLNGGSSLGFSNQFKGKIREVHLAGEAFFEVKSNPKKPFVV